MCWLWGAHVHSHSHHSSWFILLTFWKCCWGFFCSLCHITDFPFAWVPWTHNYNLLTLKRLPDVFYPLLPLSLLPLLQNPSRSGLHSESVFSPIPLCWNYWSNAIISKAPVSSKWPSSQWWAKLTLSVTFLENLVALPSKSECFSPFHWSALTQTTTASCLNDFQGFLTGRPASTLTSYYMLLTWEPEGSLKNELIF